jgi:hypothetical protein
MKPLVHSHTSVASLIYVVCDQLLWMLQGINESSFVACAGLIGGTIWVLCAPQCHTHLVTKRNLQLPPAYRGWKFPVTPLPPCQPLRPNDNAYLNMPLPSTQLLQLQCSRNLLHRHRTLDVLFVCKNEQWETRTRSFSGYPVQRYALFVYPLSIGGIDNQDEPSPCICQFFVV